MTSAAILEDMTTADFFDTMGKRIRILRDCCYWHYIAPGEIIENTSSRRIEIPRTNKLTPDVLTHLMEQLRNRTLP